jgi:hypothetical protein
VDQNWAGSAWENSVQYIYTYDESNNWTTLIRQSWTGNAWVISQQGKNTRDASEFTIMTSNKYWNSAGTYANYGDSTRYYYHSGTTAINDLSVTDGNFIIYPNPSASQITIKTPATSQKNSILSIYNFRGQLITTLQKTEQLTTIDISNLTSGVYFVRMTDERTVQVEKFVKK